MGTVLLDLLLNQGACWPLPRNRSSDDILCNFTREILLEMSG